MRTVMLWLIKLSVIFGAACGWTNGDKGASCYDCHYVTAKDGYGGFKRCSLTEPDDAYFINKLTCEYGKCFIRMDPNGQIYRGCADHWNLQWGVDTYSNCSSQETTGSIWWFCDGHLCNDGSLTDNNRCGSLGLSEHQEPAPNSGKSVGSKGLPEPPYHDHSLDEMEVLRGDHPKSRVVYQAPDPVPETSNPEPHNVHAQGETVYGVVSKSQASAARSTRTVGKKGHPKSDQSKSHVPVDYNPKGHTAATGKQHPYGHAPFWVWRWLPGPDHYQHTTQPYSAGYWHTHQLPHPKGSSDQKVGKTSSSHAKSIDKPQGKTINNEEGRKSSYHPKTTQQQDQGDQHPKTVNNFHPKKHQPEHGKSHVKSTDQQHPKHNPPKGVVYFQPKVYKPQDHGTHPKGYPQKGPSDFHPKTSTVRNSHPKDTTMNKMPDYHPKSHKPAKAEGSKSMPSPKNDYHHPKEYHPKSTGVYHPKKTTPPKSDQRPAKSQKSHHPKADPKSPYAHPKFHPKDTGGYRGGISSYYQKPHYQTHPKYPQNKDEVDLEGVPEQVTYTSSDQDGPLPQGKEPYQSPLYSTDDFQASDDVKDDVVIDDGRWDDAMTSAGEADGAEYNVQAEGNSPDQPMNEADFLTYYDNFNMDNVHQPDHSIDSYVGPDVCPRECQSSQMLFAHPTKADHYIQCGSGHHRGQACECCQPFERICPRGTTFDVYSGVCSQVGGTQVNGPQYKTIDFDSDNEYYY